jgi:hypothetical protein
MDFSDSAGVGRQLRRGAFLFHAAARIAPFCLTSLSMCVAHNSHAAFISGL